jgi:hypothetical protein
MIVEFVIGVILCWTFTYFILKLIDQWKMKKLNRKYPSGTETIAKPVQRLDEIPIVKKEASVSVEDMIKSLKDNEV